MNHINYAIMHKKSEIKSMTKDFREVIRAYGFKYKKTVLNHLKKHLDRTKK